MTLSFVPCSDALNECETQTVSHEETSHSHKEDHDDFCSPFCTCHCCGANIVLRDYGFLEVLNSVYFPISEKVISHYPSFIPAFYENIWQPPKINA